MSNEHGLVRWLYIKNISSSDIQSIISSSCTDIGWIFSVRGLSTHNTQNFGTNTHCEKNCFFTAFPVVYKEHIFVFQKHDPPEDKIFFDLMQKLDIDVHLHIFDGME